VRTALYEAANVILTRPVRSSDLKGRALAVARRAGSRKARVALARKLAVVLHCMLRDRTNFVAHKGAPALAGLIGGDDKTGFDAISMRFVTGADAGGATAIVIAHVHLSSVERQSK
jgi:hypothetical protein